ncbi:MAG: hypothetical protein HXY40_12685 [Chloroflexi bacterium]|nr:hypothetical protein [Chloroflexota bacterium]
MRIILLGLFSALLCLALPAWAQDATPDAPGTFNISYEEVVQQTITSGGYFDTWRLVAQVGDVIVVYMRASDGLAPYVAILDPGSNQVASSAAGAVNGEVTAEWTVTQAGIYTIVATRVDDEFGSTTGSYELQVRNANPVQPTFAPEIIFQCQDFTAANVLNVDFGDDAGQTEGYRVSVYGLDGFLPVIRVYLSIANVTDCSQDESGMAGDVLTLPGGETFTVPEGDIRTAARLTFGGVERLGEVNLTIGSANSAPGRYVLVIEGLNVGTTQDVDTIRVSSGPLAAGSPVLVYMVRAANSRVDPYMESFTLDGSVLVCDDAGRRTCLSQVPAFRDAALLFADGTDLIGSRFDAGLQIAPIYDAPLQINSSSFGGNTAGFYALVFIGQLPITNP